MDLRIEVPKHPNPGETILGSDVFSSPGGKGANQAVAASLAGASTSLVGKVGTDTYAKGLLASLERAGVTTELIAQHDGPSGLAFISVDPNGENMIVLSGGANQKVLAKDVLAINFEPFDLLLMQLELPLETIMAATQKAKQKAVPIVLNAAPAQPLPKHLLSAIDYLILNQSEASLLANLAVSDVTSAHKAALTLHEQGVSNVIITLGSKGLIWQGQSQISLNAHNVEVVDTTAAGDAFCGALAAQLVSKAPLEQALRFANAAAALATTKKGAQISLANQGDIEHFLNK